MKIFVHKTGFMSHILRNLSRGYTEYTTGIIPATKVENLCKKFSDKYETDLNKNQIYYRKQKGQGNCVFVTHPMLDNHNFQFILLVSKGDHLIRSSEKLRDATAKQQRLTIDGNIYEAIQLPQKGGKAAWTWRYTSPQYDDHKFQLEEIIRQKRNRKEFMNYIGLLERSPGFRGIRNQVYHLRQKSVSDWVRINRENTKPTLPKPSGYLRHQKYPTVHIHNVVERIRQGKKPIAAEWRYTNDTGGENILSLEKV
jgi:hypothetical protein